MISRLLHSALNHRILTLGLVLLLVALGIYSYAHLKIEAYPDVGDTEVVIITKFPGRAPEEVEQQITIPLERALNSVPRLLTRRSKTIFGLSVIDLTFEDGTDDYFARQQVNEKLKDADLPDGVEPEMAPIWTPVAEIFRYEVEGNGRFTPMDLRTMQDWNIAPRILQVPGIVDVVTFGGPVKQFHILTSPAKLQRFNLVLQNVIDAVQSNNLNSGGSIIERGGQGFAVRGIGAIRDKRDIENIVVTSQNGVPIFIRDLASVEITPPTPSGILGYTIPAEKLDVNSGVQGLVVMRRGENPSEVLERLKDKLQEIGATLPEGVKIRTVIDRSTLVEQTLHTVSHTLFEGLSIVIIVLVFFLGNLRSALVVALTIPVSLLFAFILMRLTGIPANLLSLGAIDFGIIVDGAVVMAENILRRYRLATSDEKARGVIWLTLSAAQEVGREIFFSISIIVLAYLPLFTLQRVEGKLFSPMAYTLSFAVLGSMLMALTLIPVMMSWAFRNLWSAKGPQRLEWHNPLLTLLQRAYAGILNFLLRWPRATVALAVLLIVTAFWGSARVGTEFLPELDEGAFNIRCFLPTGITIHESAKVAPVIRRIVSAYPEVAAVVTQLGRNDEGSDPYGPNRFEILVTLKDYSEWPRGMDKQKLLFQLKNQLGNAVPGAVFSFSQPILDNVTEAVTGSVADLAVFISGHDLGMMRELAKEILGVIRNVHGASEFGIEQEGNQAQLAVEVRREVAARYGINVSDVQKMLEAAIGGKTISSLFDGEKRFDIVVRYLPENRNSLEAIRTLLIPSPTGARIPLSVLADIKLVDGATLIQRQDGERQMTVRTNIRGRDQGSFVEEGRQRVANSVLTPKGYAIDWGGQFENLTRARNRLLVVIPITIFLIFVLLFTLFREARFALLTLANVPFALVGAVAALLLRGYHFNVSAGVGCVSLFGVAVMSGVLLVSRINHLRENDGLDLLEAIRQGSQTQLRPILMMMLVALFGLIPAAMAMGIGSDVQRPLATVIVGGLCSSLLLTLLAIPCLYFLLERQREKIKSTLRMGEVETGSSRKHS